MYHYYKPLRNFAQKLELQNSLVALWHYSQNLDNDKAVSSEFANINPTGRATLRGLVHPWELDILSREVILNAAPSSSDGKDLYRVRDLIAAVNLIRKLQDKQRDLAPGDVILHEMHRLAQQQFPWQRSLHIKLARFHRIYRESNLNALIADRTGLTVSQYYLMGVAMAGALLNKPYFNLSQSYRELGIDDTLRNVFFQKIMFPLADLRERTKSVQEYNGNWSYTINPLRKTPLVILPNSPAVAFCPIPRFLLERISDGIFYDFTEIPGFEDVYGAAYENYVGEIAVELASNKLEVKKLEPYMIKKAQKHGADWAILDSESVLLVEAKAKRLNLRARYEFDTAAIDQEMDKLAKFVVQNYKNLADIKDGHTDFDVGSRKVFPVIVTLVEWLLFNPQSRSILEKLVRQRLSDAGLPESLLIDHPFTVMSIDEFETGIQVMNEVGIAKCMDKKCSSEHISWQMAPFLLSEFKELTDRASVTYLNSEMDRVIADAEEYVRVNKA
ncbi:hypothetical protein [Pseudomonas sp. DP-17]|uniref:hypothetical protein n=1 Tax=Pseudomonas sp. DP-17 TaxID=1580486 RepID=UPI001EFB3CC8|nr:hypothetical protein [Pseudomonas sp. DP-17]MCG8910943.1 hypothetical protein [Pseudomonas sp. DP-17]